ncbi:MAG: hypothetical protein JWN18_160 [Parcubacteria group bacterium]|nr:hypothetical protein [Parcubacteria group bacterium]
MFVTCFIALYLAVWAFVEPSQFVNTELILLTLGAAAVLSGSCAFWPTERQKEKGLHFKIVFLSAAVFLYGAAGLVGPTYLAYAAILLSIAVVVTPRHHFAPN